MKAYAIAALIASIVCAVFGGLAWTATQGLDAKALEDAIERFLGAQSPRLELSLAGDYLRSGRASLLEPEMSLPQSARYPYRPLVALYRYAQRCESARLAEVERVPALEKTLRFHKAWCEGRALSSEFFSRPPYIHPSGRSFVAMAKKTESFPQFAHVWELHDVTDPQLNLLSKLPEQALSALVARRAAFVSGKDIFFRASVKTRHSAQGPGGRGVYLVYSKEQWSAPFIPFVMGTKSCSVVGRGRAAGLCFSPAQKSRFPYEIGFWVGLVALLISLALMRFEYAKEQKRAEEERLFVLRTLTHELRTPAAGLKLSIEALRTDYAALPETSQIAFLQIADQVGRLSRVVAASAGYLSSVRGGPMRSLVPSVNDFLEVALEPFEGVRFVALPDDSAMQTDPRWLAIAIKNLVENAVVHGRPPVQVELQNQDKTLSISVSDSGSVEGMNLRRLTEPFAQGAPGQGAGLGLGLSIVDRTVGQLGGRLVLNPTPTTFTILLPALLARSVTGGGFEDSVGRG